MKKVLLVCFLLSLTIFSKAQNKSNTNQDTIFHWIQPASRQLIGQPLDKEPKFPGGEKAFQLFLKKHLKRPDEDDGVQGKVIVSFIIEKNGKLSNLEALRGPAKSFEKEALRVMALSPKWNPGIRNRKTVRAEHTVAILFSPLEN